MLQLFHHFQIYFGYLEPLHFQIKFKINLPISGEKIEAQRLLPWETFV